MSDSKTHYRKVFKSDHLGSADLEEMLEEGLPLVFTVNKVTQYIKVDGVQNSGVLVAGKRIGANIAYFKESIKPLVLNATNSKTMARITGSKFVEDWAGTTIELFIDAHVKMKGEVVGGIRIKTTLSITKEVLKALFDKKESQIPSNEIEAVENVVNGDDSKNYQRVYNYLNKL